MGREMLLELMRIKYKDERRHLRETKRIRETLRDWIRKRIGRRKYDRLMEKIKGSLEYRKRELREKYREKNCPPTETQRQRVNRET